MENSTEIPQKAKNRVTGCSSNPTPGHIPAKHSFKFERKIVLQKFIIITIITISCFLGLHLWYMEVPRLVVKFKLQLLAYSSHSNEQSELHL